MELRRGRRWLCFYFKLPPFSHADQTQANHLVSLPVPAPRSNTNLLRLLLAVYPLKAHLFPRFTTSNRRIVWPVWRESVKHRRDSLFQDRIVKKARCKVKRHCSSPHRVSRFRACLKQRVRPSATSAIAKTNTFKSRRRKIADIVTAWTRPLNTSRSRVLRIFTNPWRWVHELFTDQTAS